MVFFGVVIIGAFIFLFVWLISPDKNEIKAEKDNQNISENNSINFEKGVIDTIKDFTINYRVEDTKENINNCLFSQSFLFKSEMKLKRFSDVMEAKITQRLEENKFKLRIGDTQKEYTETSSEYSTPFYNKNYSLFISISKTKTKKIYDVFIAFIKKNQISDEEDTKEKIKNALYELSLAPDFENLGQYTEYDNELLYQVNLGMFNDKRHEEITRVFKYSIEKFMKNKGLELLTIPIQKEEHLNYTAFLTPFLLAIEEKSKNHFCLGIVIKSQDTGQEKYKHVITVNFLNAVF